MKKLIVILQLITLFVFLQGCDKYEMIKYDVGDRVNFMGFDERGNAWDDVAYLKWDGNFGVNSQGDSLKIDTVKIGVKISGEMADHPRKVAFKVKNISEERIDVILRDDYVIPADTGIASFQIYVKRPVKRDVEYKAELLFDYENSDFGAGTSERQAFSLTCQDKVTMEAWGTSQIEWDGYYCMYFGEWSDTKVRFIITTVGATSLPKWEASNDFYGDYFYLLDEFEKYKSDPTNPPLLDDNGEWISFPEF